MYHTITLPADLQKFYIQFFFFKFHETLHQLKAYVSTQFFKLFCGQKLYTHIALLFLQVAGCKDTILDQKINQN